LYWGELVVVEDRRVELAMINFGRCVDLGGKDCFRLVKDDENGNPIPAERLALLGPRLIDNFSLELAACIRSALKKDRGIDFGKLADPRSDCPYDAR
jgi:hypothetical protein